MSRPRTAVDEEAVVAAYAAGQTIAAIAREHEVGRAVITRVLDEHEVPRRDDRGRHWAANRTTDLQLVAAGAADRATRRRVVDARKHARRRGAA